MKSNSADSWDNYWGSEEKRTFLQITYSYIASFYRRRLIGPRLRNMLNLNFENGSKLLHAGCGGGEVDLFVPRNFKISALDISKEALLQYSKLHPHSETIHGDLLDLAISDKTFDGIYNLGVMEHFLPKEVDAIFETFNRILKPKGKIVLFWPPAYGSSVIFLAIFHRLLKMIKGRNFQPLHPDEPNKLFLRSSIRHQLASHGFSLLSFRMSPRDGFTYTVVVAEKYS